MKSLHVGIDDNQDSEVRFSKLYSCKKKSTNI